MTWLELLKEAVARTSQRQVAKDLRYSETAVSLALSGKYKGRTDRFAAAVVARYQGQVACPFLREVLERAACAAYASRPCSSSDPTAIRHWAACQACPNNPKHFGAPHA